jgi:hypothetical protein
MDMAGLTRRLGLNFLPPRALAKFFTQIFQAFKDEYEIPDEITWETFEY